MPDDFRATAEAVAALASAIHRRSQDERVVVECRGGSVTLDFTGAETFRGVLRQASDALRDVAASDDPEVAAALRFRVVSGGVADGEDDDAGIPTAALYLDGAEGVRLDISGGHADQGWDQGETALYAAVARRVLDAGRSWPDTPIAALDLMAAEDRKSGFWGQSRAPLPPERLEKLIAQQAARIPDAPAVTCGDVNLSYRQLDERADALAAALRDRGAGPDHVVGVLVDRSAELIVALLAVLKSGGAYLAFNPDDPQPRIEALAADAGVRVVIAEPALAERVPAQANTVVLTDHDAVPRRVDAPALGPDHLAYVSYTSGSTGEPKGVGVSHRAVCRLVRRPDWVEIRTDDVFFQISPVAFDAATFEIFGALVNGCRLVVQPGGRAELTEIGDTVRREGVSVLLLPTGLLHQMIGRQLPAFSGVRHVLTGGDVASAPLVRKLLDAHPGMLFTNGYGPTENTTYTTCWTSGAPPAGPSVPIGDPISGTSVAILDERLNPVPAGVCGELYTAGEGLARGYLGRPAATAERFLPHPFPRTPGERVYRTGDLVRRRADGAVQFIGRADQQVKIQGFRVEPGAVEDALLRLPEADQAVVAVQRGEDGAKRLIAYVVPAAAEDPGLGARLRERLASALPAYMVPWAIVVRPDLPLNRNGKVDRRALPAVSRGPRNVWNEYVAPGTALERRIADLWGRILRVEPIGVHDDFFDLGGHSLMAAELLAKLQEELGADVSARTLYLRPTVAELAAEIGRRVESAA